MSCCDAQAVAVVLEQPADHRCGHGTGRIALRSDSVRWAAQLSAAARANGANRMRKVSDHVMAAIIRPKIFRQQWQNRRLCAKMLPCIKERLGAGAGRASGLRVRRDLRGVRHRPLRRRRAQLRLQGLRARSRACRCGRRSARRSPRTTGSTPWSAPTWWPSRRSAGSDYLPEALDAVRAAADAGSIILTVCSGAFVAGAAGLLDGRPCTTHWMHADELARLYPTARVDRNVLFVDDGNLITSAGTAAGIDACLHLVRRELGSEVTNKIARRMVVPPQRDGGQRQYIDQPIPVRCSEGFAPHLDWILANLDKPHTVATLASRANMSARTFARRFVEETGRTPMQWVTDQRVLYARRLLEETDLDIDRVADRSGFGTATLLRHHFRRIIGVTPSDYRRRFACDDSVCAATA